MELPVCSQEGGHHFSPCLPADSPLPGPYGDQDHPKKHWHSSCPLSCLLILTLSKTNWSQRRNWTPHQTHVILPGPSHRPPTQICFWIPYCLCHPYFQAQHCGDLSPSRSSPWLFWWDRHPPKLLPWWWHTTLTSTQRSCTHLNSLTSCICATHQAGNQLDLVSTLRNVLQTSPFGKLCITSCSTFTRLNSSSSQGKTAITRICQSVSRTSQYRLQQLQGTWV